MRNLQMLAEVANVQTVYAKREKKKEKYQRKKVIKNQVEFCLPLVATSSVKARRPKTNFNAGFLAYLTVRTN